MNQTLIGSSNISAEILTKANLQLKLSLRVCVCVCVYTEKN
jgi:hypothetical protein